MNLLRSSGLRLTAAYTVVFALAVIMLGAVTITATRTMLSKELDSRIRAEAMALAEEYQSEGLESVIKAVMERDSTPGALDYGLQGPRGEPLAGRLAPTPAADGWSTLSIGEGRAGGEDADQVRVLVVPMAGGRRLLVGEDLDRISTVDGVILQAFGWAFLGVVLLGAGAGFALSRDVQRRFGQMSAAAEAIIDGDMERRIPLKGTGDDLDSVAATINRMLDRISALMDSLRQVSSDIAHDLRTPLTRLRHKLEASRDIRSDEERTAAVESALQDVDMILGIFAALLRIAQIEGGGRRSGFRSLDLAQIAAGVVEAFAPSAEEGERALSLQSPAPVMIDGDRELLTQMLANLVENGLAHTPVGSSIKVSVVPHKSGALLCVEDNGPGVPKEARHQLFDRFARLERSRSTPGSGLGLALVSAVAHLHHAEVELGDANPGLVVRIRFAHARARH